MTTDIDRDSTLTGLEVAALFNVHGSTISRWATKGALEPCYESPNLTLYDRDTVTRFADDLRTWRRAVLKAELETL